MPPAPLPLPIDELNLAALNFIAAVDQTELREWDITFETRGQPVRVTCKAASGDVVPHGLDGDVSAALLHLFVTQGAPADGELSFSITTLLRACRWPPTGDYFRQLRVSLERLHTSNYTVSNGWREVDSQQERWVHAKFHFISSLEFTSKDRRGAFDERTLITLRLADKVVASIRSGYVKPLDLDIMLDFARPRTRTIYRVLDGQRYDHHQSDRLRTSIEFTLHEWANLCKIPASRAANIKRALKDPHAELKAKGYLAEVTYSGRGLQQLIRYEFADPAHVVEVQEIVVPPALHKRLTDHGMTPGVARKFTRKLGAGRLKQELDRFDELCRRGLIAPKATAKMLHHFLENLDSYPQIAPEALGPRPAPLPEPEPEQPVSTDFEVPVTPELAEQLTKRVQMIIGKKLNDAQYADLKAALLDERLLMAEVYRKAVASAMPEKQMEFVLWFHAQLHPAE